MSCPFSQGKKSILRRTSSERTGRNLRVKFNPLALLLDASLEGEYDLVQRVIYDVSPAAAVVRFDRPGRTSGPLAGARGLRGPARPQKHGSDIRSLKKSNRQ